jgi:hypothetical protein
MRRRIEQRLSPQKAAASPDAARAELEQVNALYSLLENRYSKKVCYAAAARIGGWDWNRDQGLMCYVVYSMP